MDELKELDKMLSYLRSNPHPRPSRIEDLIKNAQMDVSIELGIKMFEKLIRDKYLDDSIGAVENKVTFEGELFSKYEGYEKKFEDEKSKAKLAKNSNLLIVVGAVSAALYTLLEISKWISTLLSHCG